MIVFKHKRTNKYLITNYKVMFTTLVNQSNLEKVNNKSFAFQKLLEGIKFIPKASVYFLIRNPENRLQSFFHNKFRQHIDKSNFGDWEHCQRIFFDHLGINESNPPNLIKEKILNFTYLDFIHSLPEHYQKDAHLLPQTMMTKLRFMKFKISIKNKPDKVFLMEKEEHLKELAQIFDLDLTQNENASNKDHGDFSLPNDLEQVVRKIYKGDYELYSKWN